MGLPVVTVASGGLPVKDLGGPGGIAVTEVAAYGLAVTKVTGTAGGLGVSFVTANGAAIPAVTYVTWETATAIAVTLSGGNLVATSTGGTATNQGAKVISTSGKTSGKYYFEVTLTTFAGGANTGVAVATTASTYPNMGNNATVGSQLFGSGNIWQNGTLVGGVGLSALATGNIIGVAVDLDTRKIWFRKAPSGSWNATSGSAFDPNVPTGGVTVPAGTMVPLLTFNASGNVFTANFGASAFSGAVPSGFTAGWPT